MVKKHRITQGDYAAFKVPLLLEGIEIAIAGWSLKTTVRRDPEDAAPAAEATISAYSATAWISAFPATLTATLVPGLYYFDHEATDPLGRPQTLERGQLIVEPQITQPSV